MPIKTDGTAPSGSRVITIKVGGSTDTTYIADNFTVQQPTQFLDQRDEHNEPLGGVLLDDFVTGSATLQLAAASTKLPKKGDEFSEKIDLNDAQPTTFYLTDIGTPEEKGALKKVNVSFRKKYNTGS